MDPKPFILIFSIFFFRISSVSLEIINVECEFSMRNNTEYAPGELYTCTLKTEYMYFEHPYIGNVIGSHITAKKNSDVEALYTNDLKILRIPDFSREFPRINTIYITKSPLRLLDQMDLFRYAISLEHLAVTSSQIEIIDENFCEFLFNIKTINLQNNRIFFIGTNALSKGNPLTQIYLDGNYCDFAGNKLTNCSNLQKCQSFIDDVENSTCKTIKPEKLIDFQYTNVQLEFDVSKYKENYTELEEKYDIINYQLSTTKENYEIAEKKVSNLTIEVDDLKSKIKQIELESEKCLVVNGTCRYTDDKTYGYTCIAHNIKVKSSQDAITWTGQQYNSSLNNKNVQGLIIRALDVDVVPTKLSTSFPVLKNLIINNCGLKRLSNEDFTGLSKLEVLQLSGNQITTINIGAFSALSALTELDLSKNQLISIKSSVLASSVEIKIFSVADNNLTSIDATLIWKLKNADVINVSGNTKCNEKYDKNAGDKFLPFYSAILSEC